MVKDAPSRYVSKNLVQSVCVRLAITHHTPNSCMATVVILVNGEVSMVYNVLAKLGNHGVVERRARMDISLVMSPMDSSVLLVWTRLQNTRKYHRRIHMMTQ